MKIVNLLVTLSSAWWATAYPYYPYYGANMESLSYGSSDSSRGGMVLNRYYNPYNPQGYGGGMAAFMIRQPEQQSVPSQYYLPDRRRQTPEINLAPPQENEVFYPQEKPIVTEPTDFVGPTEKADFIPTTLKPIVPEIVEPEVEEVEPEQQTKKRVSKKKKPVEEEEDEENEYPRMPTGAFFPMFFGWGRNGGGGAGGATAIANAYSTSRGGVASSHATAYGSPKPEDFTKLYKPST